MKFEIRERRGKKIVVGIYDHPPPLRYARNRRVVEILQAPHWIKGRSADWAKYRYLLHRHGCCHKPVWGYVQWPHVKELDRMFGKLPRKRLNKNIPSDGVSSGTP